MSPKHVKITLGSCAIAMPSSTRPIGSTHTGQPGPCTSSTAVGEHAVDPVAVDRVGVAAAHLHQLVRAPGLDQREDLAASARPSSASRNSSTNFIRSRSASARAAPARSRRPSPGAARAWRAPRARRSATARSRRGSVPTGPTSASGSRVEQPDVDGAPDAGDVHLRELVGIVDDLHDSAGDRQAHARRSPVRSGGLV